VKRQIMAEERAKPLADHPGEAPDAVTPDLAMMNEHEVRIEVDGPPVRGKGSVDRADNATDFARPGNLQAIRRLVPREAVNIQQIVQIGDKGVAGGHWEMSSMSFQMAPIFR